jgi:hypothetical protein
MEGRSHTMRIVRKEMPAMLDAFVEKMLPKIIETEHKAPGGRDELLSALTFLTAEVQRLSDLTASSAKAAETERSHRINKVLLALSPSPPRPLPSPPAPSPSSPSRPRPHPPPCPHRHPCATPTAQPTPLSPSRLGTNQVLREWKFRHCRPVFTAWSALCAEKRDRVRKAIGHAFNRLLGLTFGAWLGMLRNFQGQKSAAEAALFRLLHRHLTATFVAWRDDVREACEGRHVQLQRAAGRMMNRHFVTTFEPWRDHTRALLRARQWADVMGRRARARANAEAMMRVHLAWRDHVAELHSSRDLVLQRALRLRCRMTLRRTMVGWRGEARFAFEQRVAKGGRALARFGRRLESLTFDGWCQFVQQKKAILGRAAYAIGPGRIVVACFRTWQETLRLRKHAR